MKRLFRPLKSAGSHLDRYLAPIDRLTEQVLSSVANSHRWDSDSALAGLTYSLGLLWSADVVQHELIDSLLLGSQEDFMSVSDNEGWLSGDKLVEAGAQAFKPTAGSLGQRHTRAIERYRNCVRLWSNRRCRFRAKVARLWTGRCMAPILLAVAVPFSAYLGCFLEFDGISALLVLGSAAMLFGSTAFSFASTQADDTPLSRSPILGPNNLDDLISRGLKRASHPELEREKAKVRERIHVLASLSHDVRTPITRMRLRLEMADCFPERERLLHDLREAEQLIKDSVTYAKNAQLAPEVAVAIDLRSFTESLIFDYQDVGRAVHAGRVVDGVFMLKPVALRRILNNFIDNALKFAGSAEVSVTTSAFGDITIAVLDRGPGIADYELERVKQPFVRLPMDQVRGVPGSGLGLSIAECLAHDMNAKLDLKNREGGGLVAEITLRGPQPWLATDMPPTPSIADRHAPAASIGLGTRLDQ